MYNSIAKYIICCLALLLGCVSKKQVIIYADNCGVPLSNENLIGIWEFDFRVMGNKKMSADYTPVLIKYEYYSNGTYKLFDKKVIETETFDFLPFNEWVETESGNWDILVDSSMIKHTHKMFTSYNRRLKTDHSFKVKSLCKDCIIAHSYNKPSNRQETNTFNYFRRKQ
jgi:hypothetical protein